jgi:coenzyme F420-reducing hydrogenase delta subunit/ferredoxin
VKVREDQTKAESGAPLDAAEPWEPRIIALTCTWCSYAGADMAGTLRLEYPPNVNILRLPCTGQVNALYLLKAFEGGADGVIVSGCHPGDCHYSRGNLLARRRAAVMRRLFDLLGLDPRRLHFAWVSAAEGAKWAQIVGQIVEEVREAGPIGEWAANRGRPSSLVLPEPAPPPRGRPNPDSSRAVAAHLRTKARELLESGEASMVVGYRQGPLPGRTSPVLVTDPQLTDELAWDETCYANLATYLPRDPRSRIAGNDEPATTSATGGRLAVVVKPCDAKAIVALEQESQIDRKALVVLGVPCEGVWEDDRLAAKCYACPGGTASIADWRITPEGPVPGNAGPGEESDPLPTAPDPRSAQIEALWKADADERWEFWQELCYCESCVTEKHRPQWISPAANPVGNMAWNFIRAYHLVGRCVGCDECARVCPAEVRLDLVNLVMAREVEERFAYRSGEDSQTSPPLATYHPDDPEEFIR